MLDELYLEQFVLFEQAAIPLGPGLNVISGETGAGKSLVAQALGQALGGRAENDLIRADASEARVAAVFRLPSDHAAWTGLDLPPDGEGRLVLERVLRREGGGRLSAGGRPVSGTTLRPVAAGLVDFAAQNESVRLADPAYQREMLDRFGGLDAAVSRYAEAYARASGLRQRLRAGDAERERVRRRAEALGEELARIAAVDFDEKTDPVLEERIRALSRTAEVTALAADAVARLYEEDGAVASTLARIRRETDRMASLMPSLGRAAEALAEACAHVDGAVGYFRDAADELDAGVDDLDALIERAERLKALARRLGVEVAEIPARRAALEGELTECLGWDQDADQLRAALAECEPAVVELGLALRRAREKAASRLNRAVNRELADLGMNQAGFDARVTPRWRESDGVSTLWDGAGPEGLDEVEFLLAPNPGEASSPLSRTASGGEMSRALLALKTALGGVLRAPTLFLDEIDAGVGGRLGEVLGRKLWMLSRDRQVVCITHLPQVAAWADAHVRIGKATRRKRTVSTVERLDAESRLEEIAQMIHGAAATGTTRCQAGEMLGAACAAKGEAGG